MKYTKVSVSMEGEVFDAPIEFDLDDDLALEGHLEMPEVEMADATGNAAIDAASAIAAVAAADNQEEQSRIQTTNANRYKGLWKKRRRKFTKVLKAPAGHNQKTSSFDYAAAREEYSLPPTASSQQVASTISPPTPRSPPKKQLKKINAALLQDNDKKDGVISRLQKKDKNKSEKIAALKSENKDLSRQLLLEKRVSNKLIQQSISEAEAAMAQAHSIIKEAEKEKSLAENMILAEKKRSNKAVRKERAYSARKLELSKYVVI